MAESRSDTGTARIIDGKAFAAGIREKVGRAASRT